MSGKYSSSDDEPVSLGIADDNRISGEHENVYSGFSCPACGGYGRRLKDQATNDTNEWTMQCKSCDSVWKYRRSPLKIKLTPDRSIRARMIASCSLIIGIYFCYLLYGDYSFQMNGKQTTTTWDTQHLIITRSRSHRTKVFYNFTVDGKQYTGKDWVKFENPESFNLAPPISGTFTAWYDSSNPERNYLIGGLHSLGLTARIAGVVVFLLLVPVTAIFLDAKLAAYLMLLSLLIAVGYWVSWL